MSDRRVFAPFLVEIEAALKNSLSRHQKAVQQGDVDALEEEVERQKNLVNARNQLEVLQNLWPKLVRGSRLAKTSKLAERRPTPRKKRARGQITPQQAYVLPILQVLEEMGGSGNVAEVVDRVGEILSDTLTELDLGQLASRKQVRWRNAAAWARNKMKEEGLLADHSPFGVWEITEQGRAYLRRHGDELGGKSQER
jgi:restriction system protein